MSSEKMCVEGTSMKRVGGPAPVAITLMVNVFPLRLMIETVASPKVIEDPTVSTWGSGLS